MLVQSIDRAAIEYPAGRIVLASTLVPVEVRAEKPSDWSSVRSIHLAAFGDHGEVVANLVDDLRDPVARGEGLSLVAEVEDRLVGHVMFSPSLLDAPKCLVPVQVLSPIGVIPECQRMGIGTALIRRGVELLSERLVPLVFLEGPPTYYSAPRVRAGGRTRIPKAVTADPGRSVPSPPTPRLRTLDDGHPRLLRDVLEERRRRASRARRLRLAPRSCTRKPPGSSRGLWFVAPPRRGVRGEGRARGRFRSWRAPCSGCRRRR